MRPPFDIAMESGPGRSEQSESEEERIELLELRHRTRNILALIQALVNHTLKDDITIPQARERLIGRLQAMDGAVNLLLDASWQSTLLKDVVLAALIHRETYQQRLLVSGPDVGLGPAAAMTLSLAFHELESNALKHGGLSGDSGRVNIRWAIADPGGANPLVRIDWREQGGPPVTPPARSGFGTRLLSSATMRRFNGTTSLEFAADGLKWTCEASLAALAASSV